MGELKYFYLFHSMDRDEQWVTIALYKQCGKRKDIFECEVSLREIEEKMDPRVRLKKDKISKVLNDLESKEYITFVKKGKGRQKSIIRINIKDIINGKYQF